MELGADLVALVGLQGVALGATGLWRLLGQVHAALEETGFPARVLWVATYLEEVGTLLSIACEDASAVVFDDRGVGRVAASHCARLYRELSAKPPHNDKDLRSWRTSRGQHARAILAPQDSIRCNAMAQ